MKDLSTTQITHAQRELLRRRLLAWAAAQPVEPEAETISEQIDHLLDEVLHETLEPAPLALRLDDDDDDERVVITGMGLITPFGVGIEPFWEGMENGRSGIDHIRQVDVSDLPCSIGGEVPDFTPQEFMPLKEARRMSRGSQFALSAARLAVADAELLLTEDNSFMTGVLIAAGGTSFKDTEQAMQTLLERGPTRVSPLYIPMALPNMASSQVAIHLGLRGYTTTISTACAASAQAIGEAAAVIRRGDADVMLAGGTEAPLSRFALASFCAMRALSRRTDDPQRASRPFDVGRDGFVPAEGAGVLVLERLSHARRRGASIYAELTGYGVSCDAYHVTAPDPHGHGAAQALRRALRQAHISPQQVDYINAHATSTQQGDIAETLAIKDVFLEYAHSVPISAPKSMLGHLTGAAGAVEAAAAILALVNGTVPPTINLDDPDPACDLDYVPHEARSAELHTVLSHSFGFGGVNAVLVFQTFGG